MRRDSRWPDGLWDEIAGAPGRARGAHGPPARLRRAAAARLRALRRRLLDARDDGHDPQPRDRRRRRRGPRGGGGRRALRLGLATGASCRCSARSSRASRATSSRHALVARRRPTAASRSTPTSTVDRPARARRTSSSELSREHIGERAARATRSEQLRRAIDAVFRSWQNPRAAVYRRANGIPDDLGTAVNVSGWCSATSGADSATGVCFTRNPSTGAKELYGEFLENAQGEDVVAGIRTPRPLAELEQVDAGGATARLLDDDGPARGALPRHAGHRVHDRARRAVPAADAHRQAHGAGRAPRRARPRRRGRDHARGGDRPHRPAAARPAAAPDDRPGARQGRRRSPAA